MGLLGIVVLGTMGMLFLSWYSSILDGSSSGSRANAREILAGNQRSSSDTRRASADIWKFSKCTTDEMTDSKNCHAFSPSVRFPGESLRRSRSARIVYSCSKKWETSYFSFNEWPNFDSRRSSGSSNRYPVRVRIDESPPGIWTVTESSNSKFVEIEDDAQAIQVIRSASTLLVDFPFYDPSKPGRFSLTGSTAAIDKARKRCGFQGMPQYAL